MTINDDVLAEALGDAGGGVMQATDESIRAVSQLAHRQLTLEAKVKHIEEQLKEANAELKRVSEIELPTALLEMGSRGFTLEDGSKIEVNKIYTASIAQEHKAEAFSWLRTYGHEALIKSDIKVEVGKGNVDLVDRIVAEIKASYGLNAALEQSVHWQTLRAFVKEQVTGEDAASFPQELFGVYIIDKAKVVLPKTKK